MPYFRDALSLRLPYHSLHPGVKQLKARSSGPTRSRTDTGIWGLNRTARPLGDSGSLHNRWGCSPRLTTAQRNAIVNPAKGLLFFNLDNNQLEYNWGTPAAPNWQPLLDPVNIGAIGGGLGWNLLGNSLTDPTINFLGTTDAQPLVVRTNNVERMRVFSTGEVGVGVIAAPVAGMDVASDINSGQHYEIGGNRVLQSTARGRRTCCGGECRSGEYRVKQHGHRKRGASGEHDGNLQLRCWRICLAEHTTGDINTAVGGFALQSNTTGTSNTALGVNTLSSNTTGGANIAVGGSALKNNTTGVNNSAVGLNALQSNITGFKLRPRHRSLAEQYQRKHQRRRWFERLAEQHQRQ